MKKKRGYAKFNKNDLCMRHAALQSFVDNPYVPDHYVLYNNTPFPLTLKDVYLLVLCSYGVLWEWETVINPLATWFHLW